MENYALRKIKLQDDLGIEAVYLEKVRKDENVYWIEKTVKSMIHRHADMDAEADRLKIHVARIYGLLGLGMFKSESEMTDREKQLLKDTLGSIKIVGITVSGEDEGMGCTIQAKRTVFGGKTLNMNTPFMSFADEAYEFCYDLGSIYNDLNMEVYQYVFKRKFAQLEIPFEGDDSEE